MNMEMSSSNSLRWIDPIQIFIDKQLSSVWRENQLQRRQDRGKWTIKTKEQFPARNTMEDQIIRALDAKYFGGKSRDKELCEFYAKENFYTLSDIVNILGRSEKWITKYLTELSGANYE